MNSMMCGTDASSGCSTVKGLKHSSRWKMKSSVSIRTAPSLTRQPVHASVRVLPHLLCLKMPATLLLLVDFLHTLGPLRTLRPTFNLVRLALADWLPSVAGTSLADQMEALSDNCLCPLRHHTPPSTLFRHLPTSNKKKLG